MKLTCRSLAYFELYVTLAHIASKFDIEMWETTERNIEFGRDLVLPFPKEHPYHVKAKVTQVVAS